MLPFTHVVIYIRSDGRMGVLTYGVSELDCELIIEKMENAFYVEQFRYFYASVR